MIPTPLDENLRPFATPAEWEYYETYCRLRSTRKTAEALGRSVSGVSETIARVVAKAKAGGWTQAPPEMVVRGTSTLTNAAGDQVAEWVKTRIRGMDPDDAIHLPDPKKLTKLSTMTDAEGRVIVQWASEKPELQELEDLWTRFAERLGRGIPPAPGVAMNLGPSHQDLLAVYPVGDHHHGMLAWSLETGGENYDIKISQTRLAAATRQLIGTCPPCEQAFLPFLGDFFHTDSYQSVTPANRNLLDSDTRYPNMLDTGCDMVEYMVAAALERHQLVHVVFEKGNHDPSTAAAMAIFLRRLYRNEPRVSVDTSPQFFHYYRFGNVFLGTNHGDKVKPAELPGIMATDRPKDWGEATYRMWMTGHIHHESRKEYPGCFVESFGVLAPADAYAATGGWRSICQMQALLFHREHGLAGRHIVYPSMLEA